MFIHTGMFRPLEFPTFFVWLCWVLKTVYEPKKLRYDYLV